MKAQLPLLVNHLGVTCYTAQIVDQCPSKWFDIAWSVMADVPLHRNSIEDPTLGHYREVCIYHQLWDFTFTHKLCHTHSMMFFHSFISPSMYYFLVLSSIHRFKSPLFIAFIKVLTTWRHIYKYFLLEGGEHFLCVQPQQYWREVGHGQYREGSVPWQSHVPEPTSSMLSPNKATTTLVPYTYWCSQREPEVRGGA